MTEKSKSDLKFIIYPVTHLKWTIISLKFSFSMFLTIFPQSCEHISICIIVSTFSMKLIFYKLALIGVTIAELEDSNPMFHPTTPVTFIGRAREEEVLSITMNLVINEKTLISFTCVIMIVSPTIFHLVLKLSLILITVIVSDFIFVVW